MTQGANQLAPKTVDDAVAVEFYAIDGLPKNKSKTKDEQGVATARSLFLSKITKQVLYNHGLTSIRTINELLFRY